jgi:hypothetical protein
LGHIISNDGIAMDPEKIESIREWSSPKNVIEVRSFMGLTSYYRIFIEGFSKISHPITSLQKKGDPGGYRWPPTFSKWLKTVFWPFWQFTIFSRF